MLENISINTHSSIRIQDDVVIYADPFEITKEVHDADIILITHNHFDHFSPDDIRKVTKHDTFLICPDALTESNELGINVIKMKPNERLDISGVVIESVPAYNINKPFHPKANGWLGYIVNSSENGRIYIAGDTDLTDENKAVECDIALVPVGGTYTMTYTEAAELVNIIRPKYVVPTHYGSVVGSPKDGDNFFNSVDREIKVVLKI